MSKNNKSKYYLTLKGLFLKIISFILAFISLILFYELLTNFEIFTLTIFSIFSISFALLWKKSTSCYQLKINPLTQK